MKNIAKMMILFVSLFAVVFALSSQAFSRPTYPIERASIFNPLEFSALSLTSLGFITSMFFSKTKKHFKQNKLLYLIPLVVFASLWGFYMGKTYATVSSSEIMTIEWGSLATPASYVIFIDDAGMVYARNGFTGKIDYQDTDASFVIQSAIDALGTNGGKIFIKEGTYILNSQLNINNWGVTIVGEGSGVTGGAVSGYAPTILKINHTNAGIYINPSDDADAEGGHRIAHLQIDGWNNASDGLKMTVIKSKFEDLIIRSCTYGVHIVGCAKSSFRDIYTRYNDYGVYIETSPVRDMNFWEVYFSNLNDEYSDEVGFYANFTGTAQKAQGLQIDRATIELADKQGMILDHWYDVTLNRMHFESNNQDNLASTYDLEIYTSHKFDINGLRANSANGDGFKMDSLK